MRFTLYSVYEFVCASVFVFSEIAKHTAAIDAHWNSFGYMIGWNLLNRVSALYSSPLCFCSFCLWMDGISFIACNAAKRIVLQESLYSNWFFMHLCEFVCVCLCLCSVWFCCSYDAKTHAHIVYRIAAQAYIKPMRLQARRHSQLINFPLIQWVLKFWIRFFFSFVFVFEVVLF